MYCCKYCNKEFSSLEAVAGHTSHCKNNPNFDYEKYNMKTIIPNINI